MNQLSTGGFYPKNVTGVYRGLWSKGGDGNTTEGASAEAGKDDGAGVVLREAQGRFDIPLFMASIPGVEGLSAVYGYFRLFDGESSTDRDVYAIVKGARLVLSCLALPYLARN